MIIIVILLEEKVEILRALNSYSWWLLKSCITVRISPTLIKVNKLFEKQRTCTKVMQDRY
jgi:hypothetical protein